MSARCSAHADCNACAASEAAEVIRISAESFIAVVASLHEDARLTSEMTLRQIVELAGESMETYKDDDF